MTDERQKPETTFSLHGIHLMRTVQLAQLQLSAMADTKANIVMGATFVIFTITIGKAHGAIAPVPLLILGASAFFSAICAILAVVPVTRARGKKRPLNILFFGAFTQFPEEEFVEQILTRLHTDDTVFRAMARDIYQAGTVLQVKKYRMLNYAYRTLLVGLVASGISFIVLYLT